MGGVIASRWLVLWTEQDRGSEPPSVVSARGDLFVNRAILEACLPCLAALVAACVLLRLVTRLSGARLQWSRLRRLHRCQRGGVQSLSFVVTLPLFVMIVLFILQMSQLMIGVTIVHYAAFAAARAASVWVPAEVLAAPLPESQNCLNLVGYVEEDEGARMFASLSEQDSYKFGRIRTAAVIACAAISPSRDLGVAPQTSRAQLTADAVNTFYRTLAPDSVTNARIERRIDNKIGYSDSNTEVIVEWRDAQNGRGRNTLVSPTYNPRYHTNPAIIWNPAEVGWQDPITIYVVHRYALLPGPGRFLARRLVRADGLPDRVSERIGVMAAGPSETVYTTLLTASATMTNEGIKSVRPYVFQTY